MIHGMSQPKRAIPQLFRFDKNERQWSRSVDIVFVPADCALGFIGRRPAYMSQCKRLHPLCRIFNLVY